MSAFPPDWSLQRKGARDQARHQQKIREVLKERLPELIAEDAIVTGGPDSIVRVPIRSLQQFKFRYHPGQGNRVGQDQGQARPGDVLAKAQPPAPTSSTGSLPADNPGFDYYETDVTVDEIAGLLFDELGLPSLKPNAVAPIPSPVWQFQDINKKGLMGNLDRKRSLKENLLRNARRGQARVGPWLAEDLRFKTWADQTRPDNQAVVIAMRDISGSMGDFKKRMARSVAFWMLKFLHNKYQAVEVVFLVHHTQAREVTEEQFFDLGESGGTKVSSVYELCWRVIETRYSPDRWNIYPFHFSDGDNWSDADNRRALESLDKILPRVNAFGYCEIREGGYLSTLMAAFGRVQHPRFRTVTISSRDDVYPALKRFFPRNGEGGESSHG